MCKAFSCLVDIKAKVTWKLGVNSHSDLVKLAGYKDNTADPHSMEFAKIEITPKNNDYLNPNEWVYRVDESPVPSWVGREHEAACFKAHKAWLKKLDKFIVRHPVVHPFKLMAPKVGRSRSHCLKSGPVCGPVCGPACGPMPDRSSASRFGNTSSIRRGSTRTSPSWICGTRASCRVLTAQLGDCTPGQKQRSCSLSRQRS